MCKLYLTKYNLHIYCRLENKLETFSTFYVHTLTTSELSKFPYTLMKPNIEQKGFKCMLLSSFIDEISNFFHSRT